MARFVVGVVLALSACTPAQSPAARRVGQVMSIGGVGGLTASALATGVADTHDLVVGFSVISGLGIITYAIGELSDPPKGPRPETETQKLRRWARILTERAAGAARENKCPRVRRLEKRVHVYDREIHDFVFMRDAAILRCFGGAVPGQVPAEEALHPAPLDPTLSPAPGADQVEASPAVEETPPTDPPPVIEPPPADDAAPPPVLLPPRLLPPKD